MANDFDDFISSVRYLDKEDILETAYKKHKSLDKNKPGMPTALRLEFQRAISDFLYWLETGQRPANISDQNFAKFKLICDNLVKKQQMDKSSLELFNIES